MMAATKSKCHVNCACHCLSTSMQLIHITLNKHYNAYEVDPLEGTVNCQHKNLADYHLLCISKSFNRNTCSKYHNV